MASRILLPSRFITQPGSLRLGELDGALRQQVEHEGLAFADGGTVRAARSIDQPAGAAAIELGVGRERHDHVDFAVRVTMVRPLDVFHLDDVDAEIVSDAAWLDHAAILDAATHTIAHPARGDSGAAGVED